MATLVEITDGHSRRIVDITHRRNARLQEAADARDQHLRVLPAAANLYAAFDKHVEDARRKQPATDDRPERSARAAAQQRLAAALSGLPEAAAEFAAWRKATVAILGDYHREEEEEFERFHREMEALREMEAQDLIIWDRPASS